jgi:hypothetical protein
MWSEEHVILGIQLSSSCLGSHPFEKNFYQLPFTPPSMVA